MGSSKEETTMGSHKGNNSVFVISLVTTLALVALGVFSPDSFGAAAKGVFNFLIVNFGWGYLLSMSIFVIFPILLACSPYGKLRLGGADSRPEFSTISWFAMLFSAGMGVGLVFYGVGEPLSHFLAPPFGAEPGSAQAAEDAIRASFFHWGLHPWANYSIVALSLAYFQYRKGAPALMSSMFLPLLGEKGGNHWFAKAVDILAIFATTAGIATSLGLGVMQINSGLEFMFKIPNNINVQLVIILVLGAAYTWSAVSGLDNGIKIISNLNLLLAVGLALALFIVGPSIAMIEALLTGIGDYLSNVVSQSLRLPPYGGSYREWMGGWTLFYWAWWIAWAPFVGTFIARISKGRVIREFVAGVLLVPALGSFIWFSIFGTAGLHLEMTGVANIAQAVQKDLSTGIFQMYAYYPFGKLMALVMIPLISTFFITSANSGTYVLTMYSSNGDLNPDKKKMMIWGVLQAALAFVLMKSGGLGALQTASIAAAAPFAVIMVVACWVLWRSMSQDPEVQAELKAKE